MHIIVSHLLLFVVIGLVHFSIFFIALYIIILIEVPGYLDIPLYFARTLG